MNTIVETDEEKPDDDYCLHLSTNMINFQGVSKSKLTTVCFDESNIQVFTILSGQNMTEISVKSPFIDFCTNFKIEEKGRVMFIKFSPNQEILALQRTPSMIEFFTFKDKKIINEFNYMFKGCSLLGYMWSGINELIAVTNVGIKLFKIEGKTVLIKNSVNLNVGWFTYYSRNGLLLVKVLEINKPVHLLQIRKGIINKLNSFDLYADSDYKGQSNIDRDDVIIGVIYNKPRILFVNYRTTTTSQAEVIVRTLINNTIKITNLLRIDSGGRFGLNVVDNLIIVHNQNTKSSLIFDITDANFEGIVSTHKPLVPPMSLKPNMSELYSPNWVIFQPNIVMDVIKGCLWGLEINLKGISRNFTDKNSLIKFLLLRSNSKKIIAKILLNISSDVSKLDDLSTAFYEINQIYSDFLKWNLKNWSSQSKDANEPFEDTRVVIDQEYLNNHVFSKLERQNIKNVQKTKILTWTLIEYIKSLKYYEIPAEHFIYELLIQSLVSSDNYYQLHQLLQYHVIEDSKPLACRLLSLQNEYPAASQLAIDMLERLGSAREEITEILLSDEQILTCLRYTTKFDNNELQLRHLCDKYLAAASDPLLKYSISAYFESKLNLSNGS